MHPDLIVLKFGSSVLKEPEDMRSAVHEIYRYARQGCRVIAVVSAMADETDTLLEQAGAISPDAGGHLVASFLASAERKAAALLAIYIEQAGLPVSLLDPCDVNFTIRGPHRDGEPAGIDEAALKQHLAACDVVVFPGFFGIGEDGKMSLLGRGGSDLSAIFLASRFGAKECRLLKDVDGLYEWDPAISGPRPRKYARASWADATRVAGQLVQPKAIDYARRHEFPVIVSCAGSADETIIGDQPSVMAAGSPKRAVRVALLGLGTVGYGVYQHLAKEPERFEIVKIIVRQPGNYTGLGIAPALFSTDPEQALSAGIDMLVETIGGINPALDIAGRALEQGIHVVTANKDMIAGHWNILKYLSEGNGVTLCYSASVGGGACAIEAVDTACENEGIQRLDGILNGTGNFILHQLDQGADFGTALASAQEKGYAEADPGRDINGLDAAAKLSILARHAFGRDIPPENLRIGGIENTGGLSGTLRHVAACWQEDGILHGSVSLMRIDAGSDLAGVKNARNRLVVTTESGKKTIVNGEGVGRWPTAESVFADIMEIYRGIGREKLEARTGIEPVCKDLQSSA